MALALCEPGDRVGSTIIQNHIQYRAARVVPVAQSEKRDAAGQICAGNITSEKEVRPYEREGVHY